MMQNNTNYKIYYINLDESIKRKEFMQQQFFKLGKQATRIPAVNGHHLKKTETLSINKQTVFSHFSIALPGELGVFLSYKKAWSMIAKQTEEYAILLEDDVLLDSSLFKDLPKILKHLSVNSILDISGRPGFFKKSSMTVLDSMSINYFTTPSLGTTGRIYTKLAAHNINKSMPYYLAPVDVMLQKIYQHKICVYSSTKVYVKHVEDLVGGTTIQVKSGLSYKKIFRELKRPLWRCSIVLFNLLYLLKKRV